ncbi:hypothetical protein [Streptomyces sp. S186]|uniref:hypothetical protein n=1 Tax=Streptomyces sp. S186 TaxID=3434395 RepID=UPI003F67FB3C
MRPSLRLGRALWAFEEWWGRHVTHRKLYQLLDAAHLGVEAMYTPEELATAERRINEELARRIRKGTTGSSSDASFWHAVRELEEPSG